MILAFIFLSSCLLPGVPAGHATGAARQSSVPAATQDAPANSGQTSTSSQGTAPQTPAPQQAPAAKKPATPRHKKKAAASGCETAPSSSGTATKTDDSAGSGSTPNPGSTAVPKPCPPPKIVVRQGGTSEPSIQLAGGPNDDRTTKQRNDVNQLLGVTEQNLKKIPESQLTASQRDTVGQIRQFIQQSRSAVADGDLERARTLAWKAEMLSEDLAKPKQ